VLKLDILSKLVNEVSIGHILKELQYYVWDTRPEAAEAAIRAISTCGQTLPAVSDLCVTGLMHLVQTQQQHLMCVSIVHMRALVRSNAFLASNVLVRLLPYIDQLQDERASCSMLRMASDVIQHNPLASIQLLKHSLKHFVQLDLSVKHQVLTLAVKLLASSPSDHQLRLLFVQTVDYCKYDASPDLKDRARMWRTMAEAWGVHANVQMMEGLPQLQNKSLASQWQDTLSREVLVEEQQRDVLLGSMSLELGVVLDGYTPLPEWPAAAVDASLRRTLDPPRAAKVVQVHRSSSNSSASNQDDFYDTSSSDASDNPWHGRALADNSD
jgi:AP-3 complex subunit beta